MGVGAVEGKRKPKADSTLIMEPEAELDLMTLRSQPELKPRVGCLTDVPPRCPKNRAF